MTTVIILPASDSGSMLSCSKLSLHTCCKPWNSWVCTNWDLRSKTNMIRFSLHTNNTHGVKDAVLYLLHSLCFLDHRLPDTNWHSLSGWVAVFWDIKEQHGGSTVECPGSIPFHYSLLSQDLFVCICLLYISRQMQLWVLAHLEILRCHCGVYQEWIGMSI